MYMYLAQVKTPTSSNTNRVNKVVTETKTELPQDNFAETTLMYMQILSGVLLLILILGTLFFFAIKLYILKQRLKRRDQSLRNKVFLKIQIPDDNEVEPAAAEQMYTSLYGIKRNTGFLSSFKEQDHISFEIVGQNDAIDFYAVCPKHLQNLVEKQINAVFADAEISQVEPWNIWKNGGDVQFASLILRKENYLPLNTYDDLKNDTMSGITSAMSKLHPNEAVACQMIIRPAGDNWQKSGKSFIKKYIAGKSKTDKEGRPKGPGMNKMDEEYLEKVNNKISKLGFETVIRLVSVAPDEASAKVNLTNLERAYGQFDLPTHNTFKKGNTRYPKYFVLGFIARMFPLVESVILPFEIPHLVKKEWVRNWSILNTQELASLWHMPNKNVRTPRLNWLRSKGSAAPIELPTSGLYLGYSNFRGQDVKIFMTDEDRRRHMYILGTTGTGKSELMKFMAIQDIKAGKGVAFVDPHGSAVHDIASQIPPERAGDVIYFDPASDRPMGLNILDVHTDKAKDMIINKFIDMLYELYDPNRQGIMGPQLERALRNCMLTAMYKPGGTMVEVMRLLTDENFHKQYLDVITDPVVKRYWTDEIANTTKNRKGEVMGYFVSKLDRFVTEKTMRFMLGQSKSAFDFGDVMNNKKILLADLSKGKLGAENSKFLGLLIVPRLLTAAFARIEQLEKGEAIDDFYLYIDEFQNYTTPDIETILSEARKYKLNLIVANQFIGQLPEKIKYSIFGNVGSICIFRIGTDDAQYLEKYFEPTFKQSDLLNNKVGRAYMKLLVNNQPSPAFAMTTDWEAIKNMPRRQEMADYIKKQSQEKYGRNRFIVEQEIKARSNL